MRYATAGGLLVVLVLAFATGGVAVARDGEAKWLESLDEGLEAAKKANKPIFIDYYATW